MELRGGELADESPHLRGCLFLGKVACFWHQGRGQVLDPDLAESGGVGCDVASLALAAQVEQRSTDGCGRGGSSVISGVLSEGPVEVEPGGERGVAAVSGGVGGT